MYVEPNTNIKIYHNVPLDNTYEHTIYFASKTAQDNYFHGNQNILKYTLTRQSYQRVVKGKMRIEVRSENLYDCNYLAFQNQAFGTKWFYAFITGVEYVNNETSEISFQIDVMQTYFFDVTLKESFVEREHTATDNIGDNLNSEPVELGEIVGDDFDGTGQMGAKSVVLASTGVDQVFPYKGARYSGVYSGVKYDVYDNTASDLSNLNNLLDSIGAQLTKERVVAIFSIPTCFVTAEEGAMKTYDISKTKNVTNIGTYTPRNKKLLTYPYNYIEVDNLQGTRNIYRYEFFADNNCEFLLAGDFSINAQALLVPKNYKGIAVNYNEVMSMSTSIQCSYNITSFIEGVGNSGLQMSLAGMNQNMHDKANNALIESGKDVPIPTTVNPNALEMATGLMNIGKSILHSSNYHGVSNSTILMAANILDFAFMHKHIQEQFARRIDDFFDRFGYSVKEVKIPNRNVRPHWTYTKTIGCNLIGNAPADDVRTICDIYNKGITFWNTPSEVGNYSLNNSV